ncbi:MAG: DNA-directed RNA polymerase subunit omega [Denitrovibrio sp.]|nr:MAG: DNA-directed RNA polymerase subunit omega [Denitrovibrio sp.]
MPLLDIEHVIKQDNVKSRFKLVHIAGLRARELNAPKEDSMRRQNEEYTKVTTTALSEIIEGQIAFERTMTAEEIAEEAADEANE